MPRQLFFARAFKHPHSSRGAAASCRRREQFGSGGRCVVRGKRISIGLRLELSDRADHPLTEQGRAATLARGQHLRARHCTAVAIVRGSVGPYDARRPALWLSTRNRL